MASAEARIRERARSFELSALLRLLAELGYDLRGIRFRSHRSMAFRPSLVETVEFDPPDDVARVRITLNLGLLTAQSPLPDYFFELMDGLDALAPQLRHLFAPLDHVLLQDLVATLHPELFGRGPHDDPPRTATGLLEMVSPGALHWLFGQVFPEAEVRVRRGPLGTPCVHAELRLRPDIGADASARDADRRLQEQILPLLGRLPFRLVVSVVAEPKTGADAGRGEAGELLLTFGGSAFDFGRASWEHPAPLQLPPPPGGQEPTPMTVSDELPKSRITLTYRTNIEGQTANVALPFRVLVLGNFGGRDAREKRTLAERPIRQLAPDAFDDLLREMDVQVDVPGPAKLRVDALDAFTPGGIAARVPDVQELLEKVRLLQGLKTSILNNPSLGAPFIASISEERKESNLEAVIALLAEDEVTGGKRLPITQRLEDAILEARKRVSSRIDQILHAEAFKTLEAAWRGIHELYVNTPPGRNVELSLLDVTKEELEKDFVDSAVDVSDSALFHKLYHEEYDEYGGRPYGALIGLYEFANTPADRAWLGSMAKVANGCHAPFVSAVSASFFDPDLKDFSSFDQIKDIDGLLAQPKYGSWEALRNRGEGAYIGLVLPRYLLRLPWHPQENPGGIAFYEEDVFMKSKDGEISGGDKDEYLWGNAAILFARNLVRSFVETGWCSHIRGVKGGGTIDGLPVHAFDIGGSKTIQYTRLPLEISLPDFKELQLSRAGFIPLIYKKNSATATFFGTQSIKKPQALKDEVQQEDSQLISNLAYTFAITRIAHYVKSIMRDNIGSTADAAYIQRVLESWLLDYVTTVTNPDQLTTQRYPFKGVSVKVSPVAGEVGWYDCVINVQPHVQFEGLDVELRLVSKLDA